MVKSTWLYEGICVEVLCVSISCYFIYVIVLYKMLVVVRDIINE